jgi:hypothetical protein
MMGQPIPAPTPHVSARQQNGGNNGNNNGNNGNGNNNGNNGNNNGNGQQQQTTAAAASSSAPATSSIPDSVPAGLITITQPPQTATSFYKIAPSQQITFAWNFTDLLVTQTSLTLSAVGENGYTYAVGPTDGHIPGTATSVVWDVWSYNQNAGSSVRFLIFFLSSFSIVEVDLHSLSPFCYRPFVTFLLFFYSSLIYTKITSLAANLRNGNL